MNFRLGPVPLAGPQTHAQWVGAPQRRFAWAIGFALAVAMLSLVVIRHVVGPIHLIVCAACLVLLAFAGLVAAWTAQVAGNDPYAGAVSAAPAASTRAPVDAAEAERCKVPDFAKAMGHAEKWKLHNNCR